MVIHCSPLSAQLLLSSLCTTLSLYRLKAQLSSRQFHISKSPPKTERKGIAFNNVSCTVTGVKKQHPLIRRYKEAIMIQQNNNRAPASENQKLRDQRKRIDRRVSKNPGFYYMHTTGWICRREKQRRKSDGTEH